MESGEHCKMEDAAKDIWGWLGREIVEFGFRWLAVVLVMLGFGGFFGHRYRSMKKSIAALQDQARSPTITQTFITQTLNFNVGADAHDHDRQLRNAIEAKTVHGLKETINRLPQHPLGDGHTYATLPDGTNIVTMADGTVRLALPVRLSAAFSSGLLGSLSATVTKAPPPEEGKPDVV